MASTLSLVKKATALATSGLTGLEDLPNLAGFESHNNLVKAKGILDLIVQLPSFDAELGKYSASLELCGSILARSIGCTQQALQKRSKRRSGTHDTPPPETGDRQCPAPNKAAEDADRRETTATNGATVAGQPGNTPTTWEPGDDALTFAAIIGNSAAKRALFEHAVLPLKLSEEARGFLFAGIRASGNHVLLHGPPGTGKTTLAQVTSHEAGAAFYSVTPSSILSKYHGESERVVRQLFDDAKKKKPSIIFLDEVDALAPSRDAQDDVQSRRLLAEFLLQTSQLRPRDQVVIIAATNRVEGIDIALLRRFHSRVFVGPPTHQERVDMIASFLDGIEHCLDDTQLASLASRTSGWSGSDVKSLCREASMGPVRSLYEREGELERVLTRGPVMLRPMQILDCDIAYAALVESPNTPEFDQDAGSPSV